MFIEVKYSLFRRPSLPSQLTSESSTIPQRLSWMPKNEDFYEKGHEHDTFINRQKQVEMKSQTEVIINNVSLQERTTVVLRKSTI